MTMNLGAMALVSALGVGAAGVVAQQNGYLGSAQQPPANEATAPEPGSDADPNLPPPSETTVPSSTVTGDTDCQSLIAEHQKLSADLDKYDQELERLVTTMKSASGDKAKLDATASVVEAMVTQRRDIRQRLSDVHGNTMRYLLTYASDTTNKVPCPMFESAPEDRLNQDETTPTTPPQPTMDQPQPLPQTSQPKGQTGPTGPQQPPPARPRPY